MCFFFLQIVVRALKLAIVDTTAIFWSPEVKVGERAVYQLSLAAPSDLYISSLPFSSLAIHFSDDIPPLIVRHADSDAAAPTVQRVQLGHHEISSNAESPREAEANLRWRPGGIIVFTGTLQSRVPTLLSVSDICSDTD